MLNSGADDTLRVMTALPMTLRDDRFAECHPSKKVITLKVCLFVYKLLVLGKIVLFLFYEKQYFVVASLDYSILVCCTNEQHGF